MVQEITRKILVVDDQPDILEAMRLLLKGGGYATETVSSPEQALLAAASGSHDLVLIDMNYARDTTSGRRPLPTEIVAAPGERQEEIGVSKGKKGARLAFIASNRNIVSRVREY